MRCLSCHYDLKKLSEHRCPECGREFDPGDPTTTLSQSQMRDIRNLRIFICSCPVFVIFFIAFAFITQWWIYLFFAVAFVPATVVNFVRYRRLTGDRTTFASRRSG